MVPSTILIFELGWARGQSSSFLRQLCSMYSGQTSNFNQEGSRETYPLELLAGEDGLAGFASDELLIHILLYELTLPKASHDNAKCQFLFEPHHTDPGKTSLFAGVVFPNTHVIDHTITYMVARVFPFVHTIMA